MAEAVPAYSNYGEPTLIYSEQMGFIYELNSPYSHLNDRLYYRCIRYNPRKGSLPCRGRIITTFEFGNGEEICKEEPDKHNHSPDRAKYQKYVYNYILVIINNLLNFTYF